MTAAAAAAAADDDDDNDDDTQLLLLMLLLYYCSSAAVAGAAQGHRGTSREADPCVEAVLAVLLPPPPGEVNATLSCVALHRDL